MRRTRHVLAALALALTAGCELLVRIDASDTSTGGMATGGAGGATTSTTTSTTTTSSTTTTTTTTTTTGNCDTTADCTASTDLCANAECDPATHTCTIVDVAAGGLAADSAQTAGDCKKVVCDGAGTPSSAFDDTDIPPSKEICITYACSMGEAVPTYNAVACNENSGEVCGTPGGSKQGVCVACNVSADCGPDIICQLNHCVTSSCSDQVQDGNETDVDCGGTCGACTDHLKCLIDADCQSEICSPSKTCTPASCTDGVKNQGETDKDCGGINCRPQGKLCGTNAVCAQSGDCQSLNCVSAICKAATCIDGVLNQGETDKDCGGPNCIGLCATGRICKVDADCVSGDGCQNGTLICTTQCTDKHQDGLETDTDCGGSNTCNRCANSQKCLVDTDCTSNACDGVSFLCVPDQCADHRLDGVETDKDCGGSGVCPRCNTNQKCLLDTDCVSADGCQNGTLVCSTQCTDKHQDGLETDIDCGGTNACNRCANNQKCLVDTDCTSTGCQSKSQLCVDPCTDGHKDGVETDVDCGGSNTCPRCPVSGKCAADTDCLSSACDAVSLACVTDQCQDHRKDGAETDTDCGGTTCAQCANGFLCSVDTDCTSNACDVLTTKCIADQCQDHRKDGVETDTDCGGGTCTKCVNTKHCNNNTDCLSNACDTATSTCVANQCIDHHKDGNETASDCGGGTCPLCIVGLACLLNTDCATGACDGLSFLCDTSQCSDHHQDGAETDLDCGGGTCTGCAAGLMCSVDTDCLSNACDASTNTCITDQCQDHRKDGNETDKDCGGTTCAHCANGLACLIDTDCLSNACDATTHTCIADQCQDHRKDGAETDSDCGGGTCSACGNGLVCAMGTDCQSLHCSAGHVCLVPTCTDSIKNQGESDIDCGGPNCAACHGNQSCTGPSDCTSNLCSSNVCLCSADTDCTSNACDADTNKCVGSQCIDHRKDGAETDVDCGGGTCSGCGTGLTCSTNTDCQSLHCSTGHACVAASCSDGIKNQGESDTDCGGSTACMRCPSGSKCTTGSDCAAGLSCSGGFCG